MPSLKTTLNTVFILFILFSIPVTVLIAEKASTIGTGASSYPFALTVQPDNQNLIQSGNYPYTLEFSFNNQFAKSPAPVYLEFTGIPKGTVLLGQPIGSTPSNNFQKVHKFSLITTPQTPMGNYTIVVTASDLIRFTKSSFTFNLKKV